MVLVAAVLCTCCCCALHLLLLCSALVAAVLCTCCCCALHLLLLCSALVVLVSSWLWGPLFPTHYCIDHGGPALHPTLVSYPGCWLGVCPFRLLLCLCTAGVYHGFWLGNAWDQCLVLYRSTMISNILCYCQMFLRSFFFIFFIDWCQVVAKAESMRDNCRSSMTVERRKQKEVTKGIADVSTCSSC